jgi:hypothetical protein
MVYLAKMSFRVQAEYQDKVGDSLSPSKLKRPFSVAGSIGHLSTPHLLHKD